jgi:hypothetical protein
MAVDLAIGSSDPINHKHRGSCSETSVKTITSSREIRSTNVVAASVITIAVEDDRTALGRVDGIG